jgi:hypothetical protein
MLWRATQLHTKLRGVAHLRPAQRDPRVLSLQDSLEIELKITGLSWGSQNAWHLICRIQAELYEPHGQNAKVSACEFTGGACIKVSYDSWRLIQELPETDAQVGMLG